MLNVSLFTFQNGYLKDFEYHTTIICHISEQVCKYLQLYSFTCILFLAYETSEAAISFENEDEEESNYLESPPNLEGEREEEVIIPLEVEVEEEVADTIESEQETPATDVDEIEPEVTIFEEVISEGEQVLENSVDANDEGFLSESLILPEIPSSRKHEESTASFEMYISDMFDFRTNSS